jgi:hypothetical protein
MDNVDDFNMKLKNVLQKKVDVFNGIEWAWMVKNYYHDKFEKLDKS